MLVHLSENGFSCVGIKASETTQRFTGWGREGLQREEAEILSMLITSSTSMSSHLKNCLLLLAKYLTHKSLYSFEINTKCSCLPLPLMKAMEKVSCRKMMLEDSATCSRTLEQSGRSQTQELTCTSYSRASISTPSPMYFSSAHQTKRESMNYFL